MQNKKTLFTLLTFKTSFALSMLFVSLQACSVEPAKTTNESPVEPATQKAKTTVFNVVTSDQPVYSINGQPNPAITLKRNVTYTFNLKATGHPFWIKTKNSTGTANAFTDGVTGNGTERGTLTFSVPANAPATLHYNCQLHDMMNGVITIVD